MRSACRLRLSQCKVSEIKQITQIYLMNWFKYEFAMPNILIDKDLELATILSIFALK